MLRDQRRVSATFWICGPTRPTTKARRHSERPDDEARRMRCAIEGERRSECAPCGQPRTSPPLAERPVHLPAVRSAHSEPVRARFLAEKRRRVIVFVVYFNVLLERFS